MLGILLIFFIGKYFYKLAEDYYKNKWLYAIIGIVLYYAAGLVFGVLMGIVDLIFGLNIDWDNAFGLSLFGIPIGVAAVYGLYVILKKKWGKEKIVSKDEIQNIGEKSDSHESDPIL